jgi:hypothetical protein
MRRRGGGSRGDEEERGQQEERGDRGKGCGRRELGLGLGWIATCYVQWKT